MTEALKPLPCPFCGNEFDDDLSDAVYPQNRARTLWNVVCVCGAEMLGNSLEDAINNWNRRAPQPVAQAWISVTDRLPPPFDEVFVFPVPSEWVNQASVNTVGVWSYSEYEHPFGVNHRKCNVTHWRPAFEPPTLPPEGAPHA